MDMHPIKKVKLPNGYGMPHEGAWAGRARLRNVEFIGFKAKTTLGRTAKVFELSSEASDF